jgi:hypothetical protein
MRRAQPVADRGYVRVGGLQQTDPLVERGADRAEAPRHLIRVRGQDAGAHVGIAAGQSRHARPAAGRQAARVGTLVCRVQDGLGERHGQHEGGVADRRHGRVVLLCRHPDRPCAGVDGEALHQGRARPTANDPGPVDEELGVRCLVPGGLAARHRVGADERQPEVRGALDDPPLRARDVGDDRFRAEP